MELFDNIALKRTTTKQAIIMCVHMTDEPYLLTLILTPCPFVASLVCLWFQRVINTEFY